MFNTSPFESSIKKIPDNCDIVFVADMFAEDYPGGAELTTKALIDSSPFTIFKVHSKEVNLKNIASMTEVNLDTLKANRVISQSTKKVKIFGICEISQPMAVTGILVTKGAKESIEKAGGTVTSLEAKPTKEKFVKTSKKTDKKNPSNKEESPE